VRNTYLLMCHLECSFGFDMGESKKCFLPTDSAVPWAYDDSNACYQNYNRSFPAHYESLAAFQAANAHNTFDGMFSGFHIGASGGTSVTSTLSCLSCHTSLSLMSH